MAIALVASTQAGSTNANSVTTGGIDTTGANLIVLCIGQYPNSPGTPTDNKGNTYTKIIQQQGASSQYDILYYCANPTVGSGHTFTYSQSPSYSSIVAFAFSGAATLDQSNSHAVDGFASGQPGSITPTKNGSVIVTGISAQFATTSISLDSGFTHLQANGNGNCVAYGGGYLIQSTAAAINPTWSWSGGTRGAMTIASFLPQTIGRKPQIIIS